MSAPEYLICLNCETPCYSFEWQDDQLAEALCLICGSDDTDEFVTEEDFEAITSSGH